MREWGIFSDEGLIEGQFYTREEAEQAIIERYTPDDELTVEEIEEEEEEEEEEENDDDDCEDE